MHPHVILILSSWITIGSVTKVLTIILLQYSAYRTPKINSILPLANTPGIHIHMYMLCLCMYTFQGLIILCKILLIKY